MDARRKTLRALAIMASAIILLQGCATIARGSRQKIPVTSQPIGARVFVDGRDMGMTPLVLNLKRKTPAVIRFEKQGYSPHEIRITRERASAFSWEASLSYGIGGGLILAFIMQIAHKFGGDHRGSDASWYLLEGFVGVGAAGLFTLTDIMNGAVYSLSPKSLDVFLMPVRDRPRLEVTYIDESSLRSVTWLRVRAIPVPARDDTQ